MSNQRPRISIITNGNAFSNIALTTLFDASADEYDFQVITTTGLRSNKGNRMVEAWRLVRRWGIRYTCYKLATYVVPFVHQALSRTPHFVAKTCETRQIPTKNFKSVNTPTARRAIAEFGPDLLVSYSCPYRVFPKVLALPKIGCLNVHSSLLPSYAGVCTYVHVLAEGENKTGVTVHEMVKEFDAGRIVAQREVAIQPKVSVCWLFFEQSRIAGELLVQAIKQCLEAGAIVGETQDSGERTYRGEPTSQDISALYKQGHRLSRWTELLKL